MANAVIILDDRNAFYNERVVQNLAVDIPNQIIGIEEIFYYDNGRANTVRIIEDYKQVNWAQSYFHYFQYLLCTNVILV